MNAPLQIGNCTPRSTYTPGWEPLLSHLKRFESEQRKTQAYSFMVGQKLEFTTLGAVIRKSCNVIYFSRNSNPRLTYSFRPKLRSLHGVLLSFLVGSFVVDSLLIANR